MVPAPHPMVAGMEAEDYYKGKVSRSTPAQQDYAKARATPTTPSDGGGQP
jgi:NADH-quinone oxidoreductase subunit I